MDIIINKCCMRISPFCYLCGCGTCGLCNTKNNNEKQQSKKKISIRANVNTEKTSTMTYHFYSLKTFLWYISIVWPNKIPLPLLFWYPKIWLLGYTKFLWSFQWEPLNWVNKIHDLLSTGAEASWTFRNALGMFRRHVQGYPVK